MTFLNTSLIRKLTLFLAAAMLSLSAMAADFNQTQRLANQGDADAQYSLGWKYYKGEGVRQDYVKAIEWYKKAAEQKDGTAQFLIGIMYYLGEGVRSNTTEAKEWFGKSCDNGNQAGCDQYRKLNQR